MHKNSTRPIELNTCYLVRKRTEINNCSKKRNTAKKYHRQNDYSANDLKPTLNVAFGCPKMPGSWRPRHFLKLSFHLGPEEPSTSHCYPDDLPVSSRCLDVFLLPQCHPANLIAPQCRFGSRERTLSASRGSRRWQEALRRNYIHIS